MTAPTPDLIPPEILGAYYPDGITRQAAITGGEVNTTLLVIDTNGQKTILQRLSSIYDASVGEDYEVVAAHLRGKGWEMATTLKASDGTSYLPDSSGRLWRAFTYIESTPGSGLEGDLEACAALGGLLGALHRSLAALDYKPKFSRPHAQAGLITDRQAFIEKALAASRVIALNLGMKHLIDSVEDRYFVWDTARFKSRLEFNLFCARRQRQVYKVFEA